MSTKPSAQQGRRTPLSLSGTVAKNQPNKGSVNIANGSGNNANTHQPSNIIKQDNKLQQQKNDQPIVTNLETKDSSSKRQQTLHEKKPQQNENKKASEKSQNGMGSSKQQETNENKQQQNKEIQQQPNGNDAQKIVEEDDKVKSEKPDKLEKPIKDITKAKEDKKEEQNKSESKKEENKIKESKEDKKEGSIKSDANTETPQQLKTDDKKSNDDDNVKKVEKKSQENIENMETDNQKQQTSSSTTTPKSTSKTNRTSTLVNKTPSKIGEKTPQKSTPTKPVKNAPVTKREVTTTIDDNDVEMEPLAIESSPAKPSQPEKAVNVKTAPSATSTPGKLLLPKRSIGITKSDVQLAMHPEISPERPRNFSQISGRKSIRPISDYTPSKFQSNFQFRESYRRINTELDVTNTSMNVTVGSEAASNLSFSFFGRGRKRDHTPPRHSQSAIGELKTDIETSPPKKARLDMHGLFNVVSTPITLLRNRFSKASLQSSTPVKLQQKLNTAEDNIEVQNVSSVSNHEEISIGGNADTLGEEVKETELNPDSALPSPIEVNADQQEFKEAVSEKAYEMEQSFEQSDIKSIDTPLETAVGNPNAKNKRCVVM